VNSPGPVCLEQKCSNRMSRLMQGRQLQKRGGDHHTLEPTGKK
jgi:hypothetical protein